MRFTIRHILWFTLLAGIACWWWAPSANDAKCVKRGKFDNPYGPVKRFESLEPEKEYPVISSFLSDFDFHNRDAVIVYDGTFNDNQFFEPVAYCRANGKFVFLGCRIYGGHHALFSVAKRAYIFEDAEAQLQLIDWVMAITLLTVGVGSLFVLRPDSPSQSGEPRIGEK